MASLPRFAYLKCELLRCHTDGNVILIIGLHRFASSVIEWLEWVRWGLDTACSHSWSKDYTCCRNMCNWAHGTSVALELILTVAPPFSDF